MILASAGLTGAQIFARWLILIVVLVALVAIPITVITIRKSRVRLKVTWAYAAPSYAIIATNTGSKPVTTKGLMLYVGKEPQPFPSDASFEARLGPWERTAVRCPASTAFRFAQARKVVVLDTEGREWPLRKFKHFKSHWSVLQAEIY